jgi:hypothetical protein
LVALPDSASIVREDRYPHTVFSDGDLAHGQSGQPRSPEVCHRGRRAGRSSISHVRRPPDSPSHGSAHGSRRGSRRAATKPDEPTQATTRPAALCCGIALSCGVLWWALCRGLSMACKRSGVQIPSAPPATTPSQVSRSGPLARDLPETHRQRSPERSERWPIRLLRTGPQLHRYESQRWQTLLSGRY